MMGSDATQRQLLPAYMVWYTVQYDALFPIIFLVEMMATAVVRCRTFTSSTILFVCCYVMAVYVSATIDAIMILIWNSILAIFLQK